MKKKTYVVTYKILSEVEADSSEKAIELIEDMYEPKLHPDHWAFVSAEEDDETDK
jgi:hypothetical protein